MRTYVREALALGASEEDLKLFNELSDDDDAKTNRNLSRR